MRISDILKEDKIRLSYEFFPPKANSPFEPVFNAVEEVAKLKPAFCSVTYGASGGASANTMKVAGYIQNELGGSVLAHLTCVLSKKEEIEGKLQEMKDQGIKNILALRGDLPTDDPDRREKDFMYASDLIKYLKENHDFCLGGACYPEGHVESQDKDTDIGYLKLKEEVGAEFLTSQMFFDNNLFYNFMYKIRDRGIRIPIIPGIMPVTNVNQLKRIKELSGAQLPAKFVQIADKFRDKPEAMKQAGIIYASNQIIDLISNGFKLVHVYTMNKPEIAESIHDNLSNIIES
ncbi:MAG: methylenetetrahydrofolate reductase [NAD(P)H] [Tissierellia bacterium]|nr:methylenetetrahydrofolate reductase [NAD(P)H] [Tissierellia bacterium]